VHSDYSLHNLLEKELIEIQGKAEAIGKLLPCGNSPKFMEYFGINSLED
jgi:segregation and condensation protein B